MPRRQISQLLLFVFVDVIGYTLFFPLLPYYAGEFGAGAALVGLMIASNAGAQFVMSPVVGRLSDRFGRRPLILASILGTMVSFLLLGLVDPLADALAQRVDFFWGQDAAGWAIALLFFCRILDGISGGNISLARAYVSDITTEDRRAQGLGFIGAAFGLGFVIGPALGGVTSSWQPAVDLVSPFGFSRFAVPAFLAVLISLLNFIGVALFLPESLRRRRAGAASPGGSDFEEKRPPAFHGTLARFLGIRLLFSLAITLFMANFPIFSQSHMDFSEQQTSFLLVYAGVLLILVQALGVRWFTGRFSEMRILWVSIFVVTVSLLGLGLASSVRSMLLVLTPLALSGGLLNTVINSLVSKSVGEDDVGGALGWATSMESLSWVVAPVIGGAVIQYAGGTIFAGLAAGVSALMIPYFLFVLRNRTARRA